MSTKPTHSELERAIASVPGVEEAHVTLLPETGKSRLRIRLSNGEDAPTVSWAISATLRERFGIVLDPEAIRPRLSVSEGVTAEGAETQVRPARSAPASSPAEDDADDREPTAAAETSDTAASEPDDPLEDRVVVIGDRVSLSEAARAVLSESIESEEPQGPLDGTTGPAPEHGATGPGAHAPGGTIRDLGADDDVAWPRLVEEAPGTDEDQEAATSHRRVWAVDDDTDAEAGLTAEESEALELSRESARAAIRHLDTRIDVSDVRVTATLAHGGRYVTGEASSVPTRKGILRAVAEATVSALRQLTGDRLVVGVDSVVASVAGEPPMATVLVGIVTEAGEETLLGSSLVRQDPERAVMRATLDALNRRVEPWLEFDLTG